MLLDILDMGSPPVFLACLKGGAERTSRACCHAARGRPSLFRKEVGGGYRRTINRGGQGGQNADKSGQQVDKGGHTTGRHTTDRSTAIPRHPHHSQVNYMEIISSYRRSLVYRDEWVTWVTMGHGLFVFPV
jgi:hypothetical protein